VRRPVVVVLAFVCVAGDCRSPETGQLGNVDYSWHDASVWSYGEAALAAHGGRARMDLRGHERGCISSSVDVATVAVADPTIASAILIDHATIDLVGAAAGTSTVELHDGDGATIDRIPFAVAEIDSLVPAAFGQPPPTLLFAGSTVDLRTTATPIAQYATSIVGAGAIAKASADGTVEVVAPESVPTAVTGAELDIVARGGVGSGGVTVAAGGRSLRYPLRVVDGSAVDRLGLSTSGNAVAISDYRQWLTVTASAGGQIVAGARCIWTAPDGGPLDDHLALDAYSTPEYPIFYITAPGAYPVMCTIGAQRAVVTLER
jgi:hypothetical protein